MTIEEAIYKLEQTKRYSKYLSDDEIAAIVVAIEALEQDTVPFDFDLYQSGLMDMPEEMIKVLDKIKTEIETDLSHFCFDEWGNENPTWKEIKAIIDKYKAESEDKE